MPSLQSALVHTGGHGSFLRGGGGDELPNIVKKQCFGENLVSGRGAAAHLDPGLASAGRSSGCCGQALTETELSWPWYTV